MKSNAVASDDDGFYLRASARSRPSQGGRSDDEGRFNDLDVVRCLQDVELLNGVRRYLAFREEHRRRHRGLSRQTLDAIAAPELQTALRRNLEHELYRPRVLR